MEAAKLRQRVRALERERQVLVRPLLRPGPMVSGGLVEQWIVCGKIGCRCSTGDRHGPYYYRSVLKPEGPRLEYVGTGERHDVPLLQRYQQYQRRMARLNTLHREMVKLLWQLAEQQIRQPTRTGGAR
jgi:hypothetical protein